MTPRAGAADAPAPPRGAGGVLGQAAAVLAAAQVPSPEVDAAALLAAVLHVRPARVAALRALDAPLAPDDVRRLDALVARRADREPMQHLVGTAAFRHLDLPVGPGVLVPRPETELLVDHVLAHLRAAVHLRAAPLADARVVDLCAGGGALALAVAAEAPGAGAERLEVTAVEVDERALAWLRRGVAAVAPSVAARVRVVAGDVTDVGLTSPGGALADLAGRCRAVVTNPPYLPDDALAALPPEVRHDPRVALAGGTDGLDVVRAVVARAAVLLAPGGLLVCEHGDDQSDAVRRLVEAVPAGGRRAYADVRGHDDLAGRPRLVTARRAGSSS